LFAQGIAISPTGRFVYELAMESGGRALSAVVPIDVNTESALKPILISQGARAMAITSNGQMGYVTGTSVVTPIDLGTHVVEPSISVPMAELYGPIALSPNGDIAYVTGNILGLGEVLVPVNLVTRKAERPVPVPRGAYGLVVTPDGKTAYVTGSEITPIDLVTSRAEEPIGFVLPRNRESAIVVDAPLDRAYVLLGSTVDPNGGSIVYKTAWRSGKRWVGFPTGGEIIPINLQTRMVGSPISTGPFAIGLPGDPNMAISENGRTAYLTELIGSLRSGDRFWSPNLNAVVPINLTTRTVGNPVIVPGGASGVVSTPTND